MNKKNQRPIWRLDNDGPLPQAAELLGRVELLFGPLADESLESSAGEPLDTLVIAKKARALERLPEHMLFCIFSCWHDIPVGRAGVEDLGSGNQLLGVILSDALQQTTSEPFMTLLIDESTNRCVLMMIWSEKIWAEKGHRGAWPGVARETILHVAQAIERFLPGGS